MAAAPLALLLSPASYGSQATLTLCLNSHRFGYRKALILQSQLITGLFLLYISPREAWAYVLASLPAHVSWQTWEGGLPSGIQLAGDQTCFCTRELGSSVSTGSSISEDTMANRLDHSQGHRWGGVLTGLALPHPIGQGATGCFNAEYMLLAGGSNHRAPSLLVARLPGWKQEWSRGNLSAT